jgi:ABC-2 type transport system permease protein
MNSTSTAADLPFALWIRRAVHRWLSLGACLTGAHWQILLTYRGMFLIQALRSLLMPSVLMAAWLSVEKVPGNPYGQGDYLLYYLCLPVVMTCVDCWMVYSFPGEIRDGTLNRHLLKPAHPFWYHLTEHVTYKMMQLLFLLPMIGLLAWFLGDRLPAVGLGVTRVFLTLSVLGLAVGLRFVMNTALALTGFWLEHVETLNLVLNQGLWAVLGGMVVPLETLPEWVQGWTRLLPYRYTLSFPLEVLRGRLPPDALLNGLLIGIGWSLVFVFLCRRLWRGGLREYTAYGG